MNASKQVLKSLPYIAAVLGQQYGIRIEIHGNQAYTDGKTIVIPQLPMDCDDTLINLARAYTDHEAAHIRDTDFAVLKKCQTPFEQYLLNVLEDVRIERKLGKIYPGCRQNLTWLCNHIFSDAFSRHDGKVISAVSFFILLTARSWDVPALSEQAALFGLEVDRQIQGLRSVLAPILARVNAHNASTGQSLDYARELVAAIANFMPPPSDSNPPTPNKGSQDDAEADDLDEAQPDEASATPELLQSILKASADELPDDMGNHLRQALGDASEAASDNCVSLPKESAMIGTLRGVEKYAPHISAMRTRLQALLQAQTLKRVMPGRSGKLDTGRLHILSTGGTKLFRRSTQVHGMSTAVHIVLDASCSMGSLMQLATASCYITAKALEGLQVNVGVTAFNELNKSYCAVPSVYPAVHHGQPVTATMSVSAFGGTPLAETLWYVMGKMIPLRENRKIILLLTDGCPNNKETAQKAIADVQSLGLEIYGIGIHHERISEYFSADRHAIIHGLNELAPAMFRILFRAMSIR